MAESAASGSGRQIGAGWSWPDVALARSDRDVAAEHRGILDAVLAHDAGKAAAALATHIQNTTNVLLDQVSTAPEDTATA